MYNRIIKYCIYSLVFLLPLFFLPFSFEAFEFNKQYLLFFLVSAAFFCWIAKMVLVDKEIRFKRTPLDIPILAFLFVAILGAVFSVDKSSSIFGFYGRFSDGLIGLISLVMLYFLITNNVSLKEKLLINADKKIGINQSGSVSISVSGLIKTLMWSVSFVVLFSYLSIFGVWTKLSSLFGENFSLPQVMLQRTFNPVAGSLEGLSIFLAITLVFLVGRILSTTQKKGGAINYLLLIAALLLLVMVDFTAAWLILLVSLALFIVIILWKRMFREDVNKLLLPILLIVLAAAFLFVDTSAIQSSILNSQLPKEQVLNQGQSWSIGLKGATESVKSGFLGSGIGTFHYDFSKFKPAEFNQTPLWQIRFDRPGSHLAEILGSLGFLGMLSYLLLIGFFLMISYFFLQQNKSGMPLFMIFLALIVSQFVYYQNTTLGFLFWLVMALSVVNWQKPVKEKTISFKDFPELSLVFSALLIVLGILIVGMYFFAVKFYLADINYRTALGAERTQKLEKAVDLNPYQPQYKIVLARDYLAKVLAENQKPAGERDQAALSRSVYRAITYGKNGQIDGNFIKGATDLSPNWVATWETLGMIYRDIQGIASGALDWGVKSFEKAIELEPANPVLHTELGKLYLISDEGEKARKKFEKAKELKPDYIDASIQIALISEGEGDLDTAIEQIESLAVSYPFNIEVLFQLGRLYFNVDRVDEAILQLEWVVNLMPNHSNAHYSLGVVYQSKGETAKAIVEFEKVLELNPNNVDVQNKLKELR